MPHQISQFYNHVDGYTYAQLVNEFFGAERSNTHEYYVDHFGPG
jgi:hypothetical protein